MCAIPGRLPVLFLLALALPLPAAARSIEPGTIRDEIILASPFYLAAAFDYQDTPSGPALAMDEAIPPDGPASAGAEPPMPSFPPLLPPGLDLDQVQQDKLFDIVYPLEPKFRELARTARIACEAMHALTAADRFDEAGARAAADAYGKAMSGMALLRARAGNQAYGLLTAAQRKAFAAGPARPGPAGRPPRDGEQPPQRCD